MHHSLYRPPSMLQTNENICLESLEAREALQLGLNCKKRKQPCLTYSKSHLTYSKSHKFKYKVTFVTDTVKTMLNVLKVIREKHLWHTKSMRSKRSNRQANGNEKVRLFHKST